MWALLWTAIGAIAMLIVTNIQSSFDFERQSREAKTKEEFETLRSRLEELHSLLDGVSKTYEANTLSWANYADCRAKFGEQEAFKLQGLPSTPKAELDRISAIVGFYAPELSIRNFELLNARQKHLQCCNPLETPLESQSIIQAFNGIHQTVLYFQNDICALYTNKKDMHLAPSELHNSTKRLLRRVHNTLAFKKAE